MRMKRSRKKLLPIIGAAVLSVLLLGAAASFFLTKALSKRVDDVHAGDGAIVAEDCRRISEDFKANLQSGFTFLEGVWNILSDGTMRDAEKMDAAKTVEALVPERKVYLLNANGVFLCLNGTKGKLTDSGALQTVLAAGQNGVMRSRLSDGTDVFFQVMPVGKQSIQGFGYEAAAFGMPVKFSGLLHQNGRSGNAYVCTTDGTVLQAAEDNTLNPENVLTYFASHGLDEATQAAFQDKMQAGKSGLLPLDAGNYHIYFASADCYNLMTVTVTPDAAVHSAETIREGSTLTRFVVLVSAGVVALFALLVITIVLLTQRLYKKEKNYAFMAMMADNSSDLFIILERKNYRVEYVSHGMELAFGIPAEYIQNNYHVLDACANHAILWPVTKLKRLGPGSRVHATEMLTNTKTKLQRTYDISAMRPKAPYDNYVMFVFSASAKEASVAQPGENEVEELLHSDKPNSLRQLFTQLQAPLNAVSELLSLSNAHLQEPNLVAQYLSSIQTKNDYLRSTVSAVLDLRSLEAGQVQFAHNQTTLPEIVQQVLNRYQPAADAKQQILRARCENVTHERILADKGRIVQVLEIVLENAINYTPQGGNISFTVEEKPFTEKGEIVYEFRIKDNGIGMSEEFRRRIFEPFTRENSAVVNQVGGAGLGMAVAGSIVQHMNGRIIVSSQLDAGTQVSITLHFATWQSTQPDVLPESKSMPKILVVYEREKQAVQLVKSAVHLGCQARRCKLEDYYTDAMQGGLFTHVLVELPYRNEKLEDEIRLLRELQPKAEFILYGRFSEADRARAQQCGITRMADTPLFTSGLKELLVGKTAEVSPVKAGPDEKLFAGKRVLFAGTVQHREMILESLSSIGMLVETTSEGQQTLVRLDAAPKGAYDLLLLDLRLPSLDGCQVAVHLRKSERSDLQALPILGLSESGTGQDSRNALMSGMNGCISYPFRLEAFLEAAYPYMQQTHEEKHAAL